METPLCIALAILAMTTLGSLATLCYVLRIWPTDRSHLQSWIQAYNRGRSDGLEIGEKMGVVNERERLGSWNVNVPVQQQAIDQIEGDAPVENDDGRVTVGEWKRGPGMAAPQE